MADARIDAVVVHTPGQPPELRSLPAPRGGEVTMRVAAAPIVPLDLLCASGTSYFGVPATPYVPGVQGVGVVETGTTAIAAGTPVWFATSAGMAPGDGSMRAVATAPERDVVALPQGADLAHVAALGTSAIAAWLALTLRGNVSAGEQVLVLGAGGIVGQSAVQLARVAGAGRVVALSRAGAGCARAGRAAPDAVVDLREDDDVDRLADRLAAACDGPLDLVIDPLWGPPAAAALRVLRPHGRLVNLGSSAAESLSIDSATLRSKSLRIAGYTNNELTPEQRRDALVRVVRECIAGRVSVDHERVPLRHATDAWTRQAAGKTDGRIILIPEGPA